MKRKKYIACVRLTAVIITVVVLAGCAATQLAISKHKLETDTKTSVSIFLDPVPDREKTVYVQIHNTSDQPKFEIKKQVSVFLKEKGYRVTNHLGYAHYLLQANILQVGKSSQSASENALAGGYGSALSGGLTGAAAVATATSSGQGILSGGLIGGLVSTITDSAVKDVVFTAITDVQISERTKGVVKEQKKTTVAQGTGSELKQQIQSNTHWLRYRTRILSRAEKVNLKFRDALPALKLGLSKSISGFF